MTDPLVKPRNSGPYRPSRSMSRNPRQVSLRTAHDPARPPDRGAFLKLEQATPACEHEKMDKRFREEHPELTADERRGRVIETAAVRTGSQVFASAFAGAAVGSALPVAGTAVGLFVGVGVGLAMSFDPDGDGKSIGDNIADAVEGAWNFGKRLFEGEE